MIGIDTHIPDVPSFCYVFSFSFVAYNNMSRYGYIRTRYTEYLANVQKVDLICARYYNM